MKYSLPLFLQKFRKATSPVLIGVFFTTMIMPWYNAWAVTGVFDTLETVANIAPVAEVKATRTLTVGTLPGDGESMDIGLCTITFSSILGATTDTVDCSGGTATIDINEDGGDTPRTTGQIAAALRTLTGVSDTDHGDLSVSGSGDDVIFTTIGTETTATEIAFSVGTVAGITSSNSTPSVEAVSAVAQVVTFTPSAPTAGETFRGTINGTNYDYTVVGTKTVQQVVEALQLLMTAHAAVTCTEDDLKVTCTADVAGTSFTYAASVVDITAPTTQDTSFATSVDKQGGATVTIVSGGETGGATWFAPNGTSSFSAGATMTTASGTATSILAPATAGAYRLYVIDAAGNISSASTAVLTVDNTAPANQDTVFATSTSKQGGATVTILSSGDIANNVWFAPSGTTSFSASATMTTASGTATSILAPATAGAYKLFIVDAAGNISTQSTATLTVDNTAPSVAITLSDSALKLGDTSTITYTFTEAPTGFTTADITTPNGTIDAVNSTVDPLVFTSTFTPTSSVEDADNIVTVGTGWTDAASNAPSSSATSANYTVDTIRPTISISMADTALKVGDTALVTFTFSESVTGFANADVTTIENGTLDTISGSGTTYTATFTPTTPIEDASNVITVDKTGVADTAGNAGSGTTSTSNYTIDTTRPTVAITLSDSALKVGETSTITFTFSEAPTGFTESDVTVENGTIGSTSSSSSTVYTALFTPTASLDLDAANIVTVGTGWTDAASNAPSSSSTSSNYQVDTLAPTTQDTSFATSVDKQGGATVTIVSGGETGGATWFAPNGTSSFSAGATMTTASGTATSILAPATAGAYRLYVIDAAGNISSASTAVLTVDNAGPITSNISTTILSNTSVLVSWSTDEASTTQVEYGFTDSYGNTTTLNSTLVTGRTVTITDLTPGTTYHYNVISIDIAGNISTTLDKTFSTNNNGGSGSNTDSGASSTWAGTVTSVTPTVSQNLQNNAAVQLNSAPETGKTITPVSFKNIQKHINNSEVPVLRSATEDGFASREQTITLAVTIRGVELAEYYACEGRHSDTQGDNISESTCQIAEKAQDAGIISRSKTTFRPLDSVTRVEAYSMLMKSACITIDKNNADWRQNVIEKAIELGFTKRTFETFSPDRSILISEIIAIGKRLESWKEQNGSCTE